MKEICMSQIKKIAIALMEKFEEEDNDYVDYRIVKGKERTIWNTLKKITDDKEEQIKVLDAIESEMFNMEDTSYRPMCNNLRALGNTIIGGR